MYFNPTVNSKQVQVNLPSGTFGMYEAITEIVSQSSYSGSVQLTIPAGEVRLIRFYASGLMPEDSEGKLYVGEDILDYHYQYDYSENLRVKALSTDQNPVITNTEFTAYCEPGNTVQGHPVQFEWFLEEVLIAGQHQSQAVLTAPAVEGVVVLKCRITANGQTAEDTLHIQVVDRIPAPPAVNGIQAATPYTAVGEMNSFTALVDPALGEVLEYEWSVSSGSLNQTDANPVNWLAPGTPGAGTISVTVTNQDQLSTTVSAGLLAKDTTLGTQKPLIWYPFDTDNRNMISDRFHATVSGAAKTEDPRGMASAAYRFTAGSNIIYTENHADLNFNEAVSLSCWVKLEQLGSERFIASHGSWQQRWKLSVTPEGFLRWTVKTSTGTSDLDGSAPIELNRYYHVVALYTGYSLELYVDGVLDAFKPFSGTIQSSTRPLTIGRMDNTETLYSLRGSVDEFRLWDKEISIPQIEILKNQWATPFGIEANEPISGIYPNPATDVVFVEFKGHDNARSISLISPDGKELKNFKTAKSIDRIQISVAELPAGTYLLKIIVNDGRMVSRKVIVK